NGDGHVVLRGRKERSGATTAVRGEIPKRCKRSTTRSSGLRPVTSCRAGGAASGSGSYFREGSVLTSTSPRMSRGLIAGRLGPRPRTPRTKEKSNHFFLRSERG